MILILMRIFFLNLFFQRKFLFVLCNLTLALLCGYKVENWTQNPGWLFTFPCDPLGWCTLAVPISNGQHRMTERDQSECKQSSLLYNNFKMAKEILHRILLQQHFTVFYFWILLNKRYWMKGWEYFKNHDKIQFIVNNTWSYFQS